MLNTLLKRSRPYAAVLMLPAVVAACGGGSGRYQGMEPAELFAIATQEFEDGDHGNAITVLDRIVVGHGNWERIAEVRLMLGDIYFDRGDYLTARSEYTRFIDRYPSHAEAVNAALGICRSLAALAPQPQRDQSYTQEAITSCRNVVIDFSGQEQSAEAARVSNELRHTLAEKEFLNAEFYFRRKLYDAAIKYYEFVARLYPESEFAPAAVLGLVRSNEAIGYEDLAEEARQQLLTRYPDSEAAAEVRPDGTGD